MRQALRIGVGLAVASFRLAAEPDTSLGECMRGVAVAEGVPLELVFAVIEVESAWQPRAVSPKGAVGLMQLMPATAYTFGVANRFDPEQNVRGGVAYLGHLLRRFGGDLRLATAAYYTGERPVVRAGLGLHSAEVVRYVERVARCYRLHRQRTSLGGGPQ